MAVDLSAKCRLWTAPLEESWVIEKWRNTETQYTQSGCTTRRDRFSMCSCRPRKRETEKERKDDFFLFFFLFSSFLLLLYIFFSRVTTHYYRSLSFFFLFLKSKRLSKAARTAYNRYRSRDRNSLTLFDVVVIVVIVLREWKHERDGIDKYQCARCKMELFMEEKKEGRERKAREGILCYSILEEQGSNWERKEIRVHMKHCKF